jgi:hypothetical protein
MDPTIDYWNVPAATPPNGTIPNFVNPPSIGYQQTTTNIVVLVIMIVVVVLRLYTRIFIVKSFGYDDCMYDSGPPLVLKHAMRIVIERYNSSEQRDVATEGQLISCWPLFGYISSRGLLCLSVVY